MTTRKTTRVFTPFTIEKTDEPHLAAIPPRYRDALVLTSDQGTRRSYGEASAILGLPVGTVKSRVSRAKDMVRELRLKAETPAAAE